MSSQSAVTYYNLPIFIQYLKDDGMMVEVVHEHFHRHLNFILFQHDQTIKLDTAAAKLESIKLGPT